MPYITEGDIEGFIMQDIDSSYSSFVSSVIDMVTQYIDDYCDTTFADSGAATRKFDGSGQNDLVIDDLQTITSVDVLDINLNSILQLTENVDYIKYPLNATSVGAPPYNRLRLLRSGKIITWPSQKASIQIQAVWGSAAVPGPIKAAALQLAARMLDKGLRGGMHVQRERLGEYDIIYEQGIADDARALGIFDILDGYRRIGLD